MPREITKKFNDTYPGKDQYIGQYWNKTRRQYRQGKASHKLTAKRLSNLTKAQGQIKKANKARMEREADFRRRTGVHPQLTLGGGPRRRVILTRAQRKEYKLLRANRVQDHKIAQYRARTAYNNTSTSKSFNKAASLKAKFNEKSKGYER